MNKKHYHSLESNDIRAKRDAQLLRLLSDAWCRNVLKIYTSPKWLNYENIIEESGYFRKHSKGVNNWADESYKPNARYFKLR
jgi:hypothetical protein